MTKCSHMFQVLSGYFMFYCIFSDKCSFQMSHITFITCVTVQQRKYQWYKWEHLLYLAAMIYSWHVSKFLMNNVINSGKFSWEYQDSLSKYCRIRLDRVIKIPKWDRAWAEEQEGEMHYCSWSVLSRIKFLTPWNIRHRKKETRQWCCTSTLSSYGEVLNKGHELFGCHMPAIKS